MADNLMADLAEGALLRITIPLSGGTRLTLDGAVEELGRTMSICIDGSEIRVPPAVSENNWVIIRDLGETILLYRGHLVKRHGPRRFSIHIESVAQHAATRKAQRVDAQVQIREWAGGASWSRLRKAQTRQVTLSSSGIRFISKDRFHPGQRLHLEISLPEKNLKRIQCTGEVIRCKPEELFQYEIAVSFIELSQEDTDILETFFLTRHFKTMHNRVKLLGEVLSPSLDQSDSPDN